MWVVKAATILAWLGIIVIAAATLFSIYVLSTPCRFDQICEMPPIHLFFFMALIISVICNFIGIMLAAIAMGDEPPVKESAKIALFFNGKMIVFSLVCAIFLLLMFMS
ncbi:hypothetical protein [Acinetobacter sp. A47]|uniref:hypothetical protein n=1 Tax=Acinetobacter sp. A47 TaxID=1561217 RepID=UPI00056FB4F3|nr:hypothetical protein [Acinetobacter sp. A47]